MTQKLPDEHIILDYLHREDKYAQQAMSWIVDAYAKRLYTTIRRWAKNHDLTNDILQETLLKIWKNRTQFQGNSSLYSWIFRIAYNETLQALKKEKKHLTTEIDAPIVSFHHHSEHFGKISAEEISTWLMEALDQLPEKQRLVFEMKYFEDLKYEEIATITGGSTGGLKANYFHAVNKIETFLKSKLNH